MGGSVPPVFGKSLPQKQAKNLIETSLRSARMYGKKRNFFSGFSGTPGRGLPSIKEPLFVKSNDMSCVMAVYCPPGVGQPSFTVCACYSSMPPLKLYRTRAMRIFNWVCNALISVAPPRGDQHQRRDHH